MLEQPVLPSRIAFSQATYSKTSLCLRLIALAAANKRFDLRFLSDLCPDVVKLGTADLAGLYNFDFVDSGGIERKYTLYAHAVRIFSYCKSLACSRILDGDNEPFICLNALDSSFYNLETDTNRISNPECGQVSSCLFRLNLLHEVHSLPLRLSLL